jgi:hypothetical protein
MGIPFTWPFWQTRAQSDCKPCSSLLEGPEGALHPGKPSESSIFQNLLATVRWTMHLIWIYGQGCSRALGQRKGRGLGEVCVCAWAWLGNAWKGDSNAMLNIHSLHALSKIAAFPDVGCLSQLAQHQDLRRLRYQMSHTCAWVALAKGIPTPCATSQSTKYGARYAV